jgi:L-lactate dehydrogenase
MADAKGLKPKVSIIGAGNVGVRYAFALVMSGLARSLVIVDVDRKKAEGEVMDLLSVMPYVPPVRIVAGGYEDMRGSDLVVFSAGKKQKPGQTRLQLTADNVALLRAIVPEVMKVSPDSIWLVAANPVDVLTYGALKISGKPWRQVIGSGTVLDSARLRLLLSERCGIDARNIHAYILGEHGQSEFAAWSRAVVGGVPFEEYCPTCRNCGDYGETRQSVFVEVRDFAAQVIERKGETSYGVALAMARITRAILHDENSILPVSSCGGDYYGVSGVCLSVPCVVNREGIREVVGMKLSGEEMESLGRSARILKEVIGEAGL